MYCTQVHFVLLGMRCFVQFLIFIFQKLQTSQETSWKPRWIECQHVQEKLHHIISYHVEDVFVGSDTTTYTSKKCKAIHSSLSFPFNLQLQESLAFKKSSAKWWTDGKWLVWYLFIQISKCYIWVFPKIVGFPPKSSILIGFSIINHPSWGPSPIVIVFNPTGCHVTNNPSSPPRTEVKAPDLTPKKNKVWMDGFCRGDWWVFSNHYQKHW